MLVNELYLMPCTNYYRSQRTIIATIASFREVFARFFRYFEAPSDVHVARYDGKDADWLVDNFDLHEFEERFGRVRDFESVESKKGWSFWRYAKRASARFGERGSAIWGQVKGYRSYIRRAVELEIEKQLAN